MTTRTRQHHTESLPLDAAYTKIWKRTRFALKSHDSRFWGEKRKLLSTMPPPSRASKIVMSAILILIIDGTLESVGQLGDGRYSMRAYAEAARVPPDLLLYLSDAQRDVLQRNDFWKHVMELKERL